MEEFPSGQRGQTVNLLSTTSMVRIHPPPPLQCEWLCRSHCFLFRQNFLTSDPCPLPLLEHMFYSNHSTIPFFLSTRSPPHPKSPLQFYGQVYVKENYLPGNPESRVAALKLWGGYPFGGGGGVYYQRRGALKARPHPTRPPAGPPSPPGEGVGKACMAYAEKYRSNNFNVT